MQQNPKPTPLVRAMVDRTVNRIREETSIPMQATTDADIRNRITNHELREAVSFVRDIRRTLDYGVLEKGATDEARQHLVALAQASQELANLINSYL